jgi:predicted transcriptional regulator
VSNVAETTRIYVLLESELVDRIDTLAEKAGRTREQEIRQALRAHCEAAERRPRAG